MRSGIVGVLSLCAVAVACGGATSEPGDGSGGAAGSGGAKSSGGSGGMTSSGGTTSTGGATSTGGKQVQSSGGKTASGGLTGSGGTLATGGTTATGGASTGGASTGGVPGCPPIPTEVQYTCPPRAFQPGDCWPYGFQINIRVAAGYPEGCEAILPQRDGFSGCGPQHCACVTVLDSSGVKTGTWECPL